MKRKWEWNIGIWEVIVLCIQIMVGIWAVDMIYRKIFLSEEETVVIDNRSAETETNAFSETEETREVHEANWEIFNVPDGYTTERYTENSVHNGVLVLPEVKFSGVTAHMTDFQDKNAYYHLKTFELAIQESALRAMNALAEAYFQETGKSDLMIYSTTECYQAEGSLYAEDFPDRSTGFCLDLAFLNEDGTFSKVTEENSAWLKQNAWRFGFIFSVPQADYHIRYVGKLHAAMMYELNLTLEEYLHELREYSVTSPYKYRTEERAVLIYFVPAAAFGSTDIPVPENKDYEISGNDTDGFIVWTTANYE